jgi:RimJ/RimL family protein N-acetyltransferase
MLGRADLFRAARRAVARRVIETERLILRGWRDEDRAPFAEMGRSAAVMAHLGPAMTAAQSDAAVARMQACQRDHGYCFWALERRDDGRFLGFCGIKPGTVGPLVGEIEIGWRLREEAWGRGYAREAAFASLAWGWANLDAARIMAITTPANTASWGLMERLGMTRRAELDFGHPDMPHGHPLHDHITYAIARPAA